MTDDDDERLRTFGAPEEEGEGATTAPPLPPGLEGGVPLGAGGMGEVVRVFDPRLRRHLALKTLRAELGVLPEVLGRFTDEAQTTAQLQHPGIVPVHGSGTLPDGRPYFTMPEVRGRSLDALVSGGEVPRRRLVEIVRRVCEAVGFAHEQGVVHRDLKPDNVMVGAHGEVLVLDWGLARVVGGADAAAEPVHTTRSEVGARLTHAGSVLGTPAFMAPEQVLGDPVSAATDVYALGGVLYHALTGQLPREGSVASILADVVAGTPVTVQGVVPELAPLVEACLARDPLDRPADATEVGDALQAWLDGSARKAEADRLLGDARATLAEAAALAARAEADRVAAAEALSGLGSGAPEAAKRPWWDREDAAAADRRRAAVLELQAEQTLWAALTRAPDHLEGRRVLAERFLVALERAEAGRDEAAALQAEVRLRAQLPHLPADAAAPFVRALEAEGRLTLVTEPAGATVVARPYVREGRRKRLGPALPLGTTPLDAVPLPAGSWQLTLTCEGHHPVTYPVAVRRREHWHGVPPDGTAPAPVPLPPLGSLGPDDRYVPRGWFVAGGDPEAAGGLPRQRVWCEGFVMRAWPIRCLEHLAFLQARVDAGRADEVPTLSPREWHGRDQGGRAFWSVGPDGRVAMGPDTDGDVWDPHWPLLMVDYATMVAHAAWRAEVDGLPWRLPAELEWEKAARGVDGRWFPWGDHLDPTWCAMRDSPTVGPAVGDAYPVDTSPYGVRHLGGSASDWCLDRPEGPHAVDGRVVVPDLDLDAPRHTSRGGSWGSASGNCRTAFRGFGSSGRGLYSQTARLVRPWPVSR